VPNDGNRSTEKEDNRVLLEAKEQKMTKKDEESKEEK
jgi:hypothetical protein